MESSGDKGSLLTVIYSGSFDPIHNGHVALARYVASIPYVQEVWLVPSRRNPFKPDTTAPDDVRLEMARLATAQTESVRVSDVEMHLPSPSYTISTLRHLHALYPDRKFRLLIGADNWREFPLWREYKRLLSDYPPLIYPRPGYPIDKEQLPDKVVYLDKAPQLPLSSTEVRERVGNGTPIDGLVPKEVQEFIKSHNLYREK